METEAMRKELQEIIEKGDDMLIADLYEVATDYHESFELSEDELEELNRRRERYLSGESKSYYWKEAMEMVMQKRVIK